MCELNAWVETEQLFVADPGAHEQSQAQAVARELKLVFSKASVYVESSRAVILGSEVSCRHRV
jgi:hypothetical protein